MKNELTRTKMLIGEDAINKLKNSKVAVFGIGGVGGYTVEALARCGIGTLDLIDSDTVDITNLNRQIYALHSTIGKNKTDVAKERIHDINPDINVNTYNVFYLPENSNEFDLSKYDYVVDAIDTVTAKIELIVNAQKVNTPIISSMGTGNKLSADRLEVSDIYSTCVCPLARVMRKELKARGIKKLKVIYSKEEIIKNASNIPASISFVPATAGLLIAQEVIKDLISK
ncbi:MAG: tRNA threonylcarbamoyladenosine dehydratase [Acutalibacteraceae bacterium]|nr:tRNA threonylcarbamoyladenosine dehydratase [Acutalibacteraceae bacterium]